MKNKSEQAITVILSIMLIAFTALSVVCLVVAFNSPELTQTQVILRVLGVG